MSQGSANEFLSAVEALPRDFTFLIRVFDKLGRFRKSDGAALLMPEEVARTLVPMSTEGLDGTTKRRLRLPAKLIKAITTRQLDAVHGTAMMPFEPYFSIREYSAMDRLLVAKVMSGTDVAAAFLLTYEQSRPESASDHDHALLLSLLSLFSRVRIAGLDVLRRIGTVEPVVGETDSVLSILRQSAEDDAHAVLVKLDLERILSILTPDSPSLDRYRYRHTLLGLFSAVVPYHRPALPVPGELLLTFANKSLHDANLILAHIDNILKSLFADFETIRTAVLQIATYSQEQGSPEAFLNRFL